MSSNQSEPGNGLEKEKIKSEIGIAKEGGGGKKVGDPKKCRQDIAGLRVRDQGSGWGIQCGWGKSSCFP